MRGLFSVSTLPFLVPWGEKMYETVFSVAQLKIQSFLPCTQVESVGLQVISPTGFWYTALGGWRKHPKYYLASVYVTEDKMY